MCSHGNTTDVQVTVDGSLAHEGVDTVKTKPIDECIAEIVAALEAAGIRMLGSCCGHDKSTGEIPLADGRVLQITAPGRVEYGVQCDHADWDLEPLSEDWARHVVERCLVMSHQATLMRRTISDWQAVSP